MKPARAFGVVGARLQTISGIDVAPVIDAIAAQPILAISVAIVGAATIPSVGLTHPIETRRRAAFANRIAHLTAVTMGIGRAFHATTVGIANQAIRALVVVTARHAMITAADRAARTIRTALAAQHAGEAAAVTSQRAAAVIVVQALNASACFAIANIAGRTTCSIGETTRCAVVFKAGLATITAVVVTAPGHALVVLTARIMPTTRVLAAAVLAQACFTDSSCTTTCVLRAGLAALVFDASLTSEAMTVVDAAVDALVVNTTLAFVAGVVFAATNAAFVLQTDLPIRTGIIVGTAAHTLAITTKGAFSAGLLIIIAMTAGLTIVVLTNGANTAVRVVAAR